MLKSKAVILCVTYVNGAVGQRQICVKCCLAYIEHTTVQGSVFVAVVDLLACDRNCTAYGFTHVKMSVQRICTQFFSLFAHFQLKATSDLRNS